MAQCLLRQLQSIHRYLHLPGTASLRVLMGCCSIWCNAWFQEQGGGCIKQLRQRDVRVQRHKTVTPFTLPEYDFKLHQACMYRWAEKGFKCFSKTHPTHQGAAVPRQELVPPHSTSYPADSQYPKPSPGSAADLSFSPWHVPEAGELTGEAWADLCVCFWLPSLPAELTHTALTVHLFEVHREQPGQSVSK